MIVYSGAKPFVCCVNNFSFGHTLMIIKVTYTFISNGSAVSGIDFNIDLEDA